MHAGDRLGKMDVSGKLFVLGGGAVIYTLPTGHGSRCIVVAGSPFLVY